MNIENENIENIENENIENIENENIENIENENIENENIENENIENRYEFIILFDVENGNPNGDPDAGNMPRVDPETSLGIVTDVCLKRKIRNYVEIVKPNEPGYNILIKADKSLNAKFKDAYDKNNLKENKKDKNKDDVEIARKYICKNYYDVRTFGAVMTTGNYSSGIVRGPIQINFAQSIDPVLPQEISITRQALTTDKDFNEKSNTIGKKNFIPYGLYKAEGYISALLAQKTGFSQDDLELTFEAIKNMFEHDHSSLRGKICMRKLIVFKHESALGNALSHELFDKLTISRKKDVDVARKFTDYDIVLNKNMPEGITLIEKI
ncbi:MAG: type I-C CRISPR-associated protein Cas7/Csd2 [bacterium]